MRIGAILLGAVVGLAGAGGCSSASRPSAAPTVLSASVERTTTVQATSKALALPACAVKPCADYHGILLQVGAISEHYAPASDGFTIARFVMTFRDISGEHQPGAGASFALRDQLGEWQSSPVTHEVGKLADPTCGDPSTLDGASLAPGGTAGPLALCFKIPSVTGKRPLTLAWGPDGLGCDPDDIPTTITPPPTGLDFTGYAPACGVVLLAI